MLNLLIETGGGISEFKTKSIIVVTIIIIILSISIRRAQEENRLQLINWLFERIVPKPC